MADSWGTERAGETNVPRFLRDVGSTPAPRKAAIGAQSKSGSFSDLLFFKSLLFHYFTFIQLGIHHIPMPFVSKPPNIENCGREFVSKRMVFW